MADVIEQMVKEIAALKRQVQRIDQREYGGGGGTTITPITIETTDDTPTVMATWTIPDQEVVVVSGLLKASVTGNAGGYVALFQMMSLSSRDGGDVAIRWQGNYAIYKESLAWDATFSIDGTNVNLVVTGDATLDVTWTFYAGTIDLVVG